MSDPFLSDIGLKNKMAWVWTTLKVKIKVFLRSVIDASFVYLQWTIYPYKTVVPLIFPCTRWPCPHTVECWPSRVKEKTIFYHYMYIAAAITALLNLAEIVYIGPRRILNAFTCVKGMITPYQG